jgi:methylase of polypeptide subunit release factors
MTGVASFPGLIMRIPFVDRAFWKSDVGTGSSTVALAEQGAIVTGIDIDEDALIVARDRCAAYGLKASFMPLNGRQLAGTFQARSFDLI